MSETTAQQLRQQIVELVGRYAQLELAPKVFVAGQSPVPPAGKVIGAGELQTMTEAVLDGWLTTGRFNDAFEKRLAKYLGRRCVLTTNSGSGYPHKATAEKGRRMMDLVVKRLAPFLVELSNAKLDEKFPFES